MDPKMKEKIDSVLERVKEPSSLMSVGSLNLVRRVSFSGAGNRLLVEMDGPGDNRMCICAGMVGDMLRDGLKRELKNEFEKEFAGLQVEFA
ncbi:MAG: hypothetical protein LBC67_00065 [Spirochaetales bacterium]|jgi:metal-sulfur cluster biosynthetic enzyme|nr:hypothetical protein [Spirochaetales bacterium]